MVEALEQVASINLKQPQSNVLFRKPPHCVVGRRFRNICSDTALTLFTLIAEVPSIHMKWQVEFVKGFPARAQDVVQQLLHTECVRFMLVRGMQCCRLIAHLSLPKFHFRVK